MAATVGAVTGQSQELLPCVFNGRRGPDTWVNLHAFQVHFQGGRCEVEQLGLELASTWHSGVAGSGSTLCATMLALQVSSTDVPAP